MGSDWIMDPILQLVERSFGIIDPTLGSMDMSAAYVILHFISQGINQHVLFMVFGSR